MADDKVVFRKKGRTPAFRKRKISENSSSSDDGTQVIRKEKKTDFSNPLIQRSLKHGRKNKVLAESSESDGDNVVVSFKSKKLASREGPSDMGATSVVETETEKSKDAQAIFERSLAVNKETKGMADDKIYRGLQNYSHFYEKKDTAQGNAASGINRQGPMRAPDHIRSTVRWDYQPDLCKDFKETGYCGFGDSCKFLHDRTDYKLGWQLEVENSKDSKRFGEESDEENYEIPSDEEHIPFKCLFCRQTFVDPVVTKCRHFFCEKCALEHFKKNKRCYVCGDNTKGMFMPAKEIEERLKNKQAGGGGDDDSD